MANVKESSEELSLLNSCDSGYKLYKRRWVMLAIFFISMVTNNFLFIQYSSVADLVAKYYDIPIDYVDIFGSVYYVVFLVGMLPFMWLTGRTSLKVVLMIGASCELVGSWIRFASTLTRSFTLAVIGQILCGIGQPCTVGMSSELAGTWFGIDEVSLACGIGYTGLEIGVGAGYIIPPLVLQNYMDTDQRIRSFFMYTAIVMSLKLPLIMFVFEAKPPLPPSKARLNASTEHTNFLQSFKAIMRNKDFLLLLATYAFVIGFLSSFAIKVTAIIMSISTSSSITNIIGVVKIICGIFGPMTGGHWLDRSKTFRSTALMICVLITVSLSAFTISFSYGSSIGTIVSLAAYWFLAASFFPIGCEQAVEVTYPIPEVVSSCILNGAALACAICMVGLIDLGIYLTNQRDTMVAFCFLHLIPVLFAYLIRSDNKRQDADKYNSCTEEENELNTLDKHYD